MQLGIGTYTFPWAIGSNFFKPPYPLTAVELLQFAARENIRVVQFGDNYPLHHLPENELVQLKQLADEKGVQIEVGTRRLTVENVTAYLSIVCLMKATFLRIIIDDSDYKPHEAEVMQTIKKLVPQLQESNIILAIENHDRFPAQTLKRIIESTDPQYVGICLDTANSLGAGEGVHEVVAQLAPYAVNLHIKDFSIQRVAHKMGFRVRGCQAGSGLLNIPWLIDEVAKWNRCHTAILEVWSDPEPTVEATLQKERRWVAESLDYLKTVWHE